MKKLIVLLVGMLCGLNVGVNAFADASATSLLGVWEMKVPAHRGSFDGRFRMFYDLEPTGKITQFMTLGLQNQSTEGEFQIGPDQAVRFRFGASAPWNEGHWSVTSAGELNICPNDSGKECMVLFRPQMPPTFHSGEHEVPAIRATARLELIDPSGHILVTVCDVESDEKTIFPRRYEQLMGVSMCLLVDEETNRIYVLGFLTAQMKHAAQDGASYLGSFQLQGGYFGETMQDLGVSEDFELGVGGSQALKFVDGEKRGRVTLELLPLGAL